MRTVTWNRAKLALLKESYQNTETDFAIELEPEGRLEFVRGYAKYLIEYLEIEFARHPDIPMQPNLEGEEGQ